MSHDLHSLPDDLPVPQDDGAGERLLHATIPSVVLSSTTGEEVDLAAASAGVRYLVVYVYPQTGVPGRPVPEGWDRIPGARGCTPQSCAFAEREHLPYPLLNDRM